MDGWVPCVESWRIWWRQTNFHSNCQRLGSRYFDQRVVSGHVSHFSIFILRQSRLFKKYVNCFLCTCSVDVGKSPDIPYVYVGHDGLVRNYKPIQVVTACSLNIYNFPFDVQNCSLTFQSWLHTSKQTHFCRVLGERSVVASSYSESKSKRILRYVIFNYARISSMKAN